MDVSITPFNAPGKGGILPANISPRWTKTMEKVTAFGKKSADVKKQSAVVGSWFCRFHAWRVRGYTRIHPVPGSSGPWRQPRLCELRKSLRTGSGLFRILWSHAGNHGFGFVGPNRRKCGWHHGNDHGNEQMDAQ